MTVIAVKDGVMATDSGVWEADNWIGSTKKIFRVEQGTALFAAAGKTPAIDAVLEWILADNHEDEKPDVDEDEFRGVLLRPTGLFKMNHQLRWYKKPGTLTSEGCHGDLVLGAMLAGASAEEAVEIAIKYGTYARGPVQVERLECLR